MRTATVIVLLAVAVAAAADRRAPARRPVAATATATATAPHKPQVFRDFSKVLNAIPTEYDLKDVPPSVAKKLCDWLTAQVKAGDSIELTGDWRGYERAKWVGDTKTETCRFKVGERKLLNQNVILYVVLKQKDRIPALESLERNAGVRITAKATGKSTVQTERINQVIRHLVLIEIDTATFRAWR
jgi:hypothetical protein